MTLPVLADQTPLLDAPNPLQVDALEGTPLLRRVDRWSVVGEALTGTETQRDPTIATRNQLSPSLRGEKSALMEALDSWAIADALQVIWANRCLMPPPLVTMTSLASLLSPLSKMVIVDAPRVRHGDHSTTSQKSQAVRDALNAVDELAAWLSLTEESIAELCAFSRRSISNWRAGAGVYPKTVRRLFEVHSFVRGLVRSVGIAGARSWLNQPLEGASLRADLLSSSDGLRTLENMANALLYERSQPRPLLAEQEDDEAGFLARRNTEGARERPIRRRRPE